jgi:hypothetical protein
LAPSNDKRELHRRERFFIDNNVCVNKNIPTGTIEEWRIKNRQKQVEYRANHHEINKDKLIKKSRAHWLINKEKYAIQIAECYQMNKVLICQKQRECHQKKSIDSNI